MLEVWLAANRRVLKLACLPAGAVAAVGAALAWGGGPVVVRGLGGAMAVSGLALITGLVHQLRRPRIAFADGQVSFFLRSGGPVAVPVEAVEAFFLGQGPAFDEARGGQRAEAVNLVARISQRWPQWEHVDVKPALGRWCEHYVTIRGAWCEPLDGEVIRRLNSRLREVHEANK